MYTRRTWPWIMLKYLEFIETLVTGTVCSHLVLMLALLTFSRSMYLFNWNRKLWTSCVSVEAVGCIWLKPLMLLTLMALVNLVVNSWVAKIYSTLLLPCYTAIYHPVTVRVVDPGCEKQLRSTLKTEVQRYCSIHVVVRICYVHILQHIPYTSHS